MWRGLNIFSWKDIAQIHFKNDVIYEHHVVTGEKIMKIRVLNIYTCII